MQLFFRQQAVKKIFKTYPHFSGLILAFYVNQIGNRNGITTSGQAQQFRLSQNIRLPMYGAIQNRIQH